MNIFEDLQSPKDDRWRHCQLNSLKDPHFKPSFFLKLHAIELKKKDYCHLLAEKRRWNFCTMKIPSPVYFFGPTFGFPPCSWDPEMALGKGGLALPSSLSGTFFLGPSNSDHDGVSGGSVGCICEDKHWQATSWSLSVHPTRWSHCSSLTRRYTEFPDSVSPHSNQGEQALA